MNFFSIPHLSKLPEDSPLRKALPVLFAGIFLLVLIACAASITTRTQISVAVVAIAGFLILRNFNTNETVRVVFLVLAAFLSVDYFYWRTFSTLTFHDPISFFFALVLYFAEVYGFIVYLLSIFVNIDPLDRKPLPLPEDRSAWPTVDVMIPTYNEDPDLLEVTLLSALEMEYPREKLKVYLLDDGGTDQWCASEDPERAAAAKQRRLQLQALCRQWGAHYVTRPRNIGSKAGNINNGLEHSSGELVVVFDADHAPTNDFLKNTVGWFLADPKMFLVQTPHFFVNPDPIEKNLQTFQTMPGENEMFYKVIQRGLDYWNSAFFCGSAALLRRKYLKETGGISGETITEDAETSLALHARGYNSAFIARPMIAGLSPETLTSFIGQRIRWAQGMVQIFILKNPLLIPGLTLPQRLCYFSSCFFWFFAYARVVFILAPLCFLLFGLKIYDANFVDFAAFAVPHLLAVFMVSDFLFGRVRWSFVSELYELIQSVFTLPAILKVFMNPRAPTFKVTSKGETLGEDYISPLAKPFYIFLILNTIALVFGIGRLIFTPEDGFPTGVTMLWAVFNIFILLAAMGTLFERRQRRATPRMPVHLAGRVRIGAKTYEADLRDLSNHGCGFVVDPAFETIFHDGTEVELSIPGDPRFERQKIHLVIRNARREIGALFVGAQFAHRTLDEMKLKVALVNGSSQRWIDFQTTRERRLGVTRSAIFLLTLGIRYSLQHFGHVMLMTNARRAGKPYETSTA
ncbi:MAG: UDP-forming cellulose synthase catalytic subunit [Terrimicrobiaceae bacterium]|nr:UDP-forming cellulose synthase catalytic subunit [Terrimicrobiaceae bacterium]